LPFVLPFLSHRSFLHEFHLWPSKDRALLTALSLWSSILNIFHRQTDWYFCSLCPLYGSLSKQHRNNYLTTLLSNTKQQPFTAIISTTTTFHRNISNSGQQLSTALTSLNTVQQLCLSAAALSGNTVPSQRGDLRQICRSVCMCVFRKDFSANS